MDISKLTHRDTPKTTIKEFGEYGKCNMPREYGKKTKIDKDELFKQAHYNIIEVYFNFIMRRLEMLLSEILIADKDKKRYGLLKKKIGSIKLLLQQIDKLYKPQEFKKRVTKKNNI